MAQIKVIHLELEGEHYYFGSPKAMFDALGKEKLGMGYNSFHSNVRLKVGVPYVNARRGYIIRVGILGQAKTNRNNNLARIWHREEEQQQAEQVAAAAAAPVAPEAAPVAAPAPQKRKKKSAEVPPEQLTLF